MELEERMFHKDSAFEQENASVERYNKRRQLQLPGEEDKREERTASLQNGTNRPLEEVYHDLDDLANDLEHTSAKVSHPLDFDPAELDTIGRRVEGIRDRVYQLLP
jgi:hypothetical protein